jgi:uncharacterized membrane protein
MPGLPHLPYLGELAGLLSACAWGATGVVIRAYLGRVPAVAVNSLRNTISSIAFVLIWLGLRGPAPVPSSGVLLLVASMIGGLVLGDSLYFEALKRIGVARAMPISMGYPVLASALAALLLGAFVLRRVDVRDLEAAHTAALVDDIQDAPVGQARHDQVGHLSQRHLGLGGIAQQRARLVQDAQAVAKPSPGGPMAPLSPPPRVPCGLFGWSHPRAPLYAVHPNLQGPRVRQN